jgi:hypothetical protein
MELKRLRHANKILLKGINIMNKKSVEANKEKIKIERNNEDFRNKVMPELKMYRDLAARYFPNNVGQPHEYSMRNYNNDIHKGGNGGPPDGIF